MKLNDLINQLQKISDQRGNPEIALSDHNNWRRHRTNITPTDYGFVAGVFDQYGFVPEEVFNGPRGFNASVTSALKRKKVKQILLISI